MSKKTFNALISRGFDTQLTNLIISKGLTLGKLKQLPSEDLLKIGIDQTKVNSILKEKRHPIPLDTVIKLLYESKRKCCVCREDGRSVIIHHIKEWHESKDHGEANLVVLCLEHHNDAHTKKGLSLNLTANQLIAFKSKWIEAVKTTDSRTILGLVNQDFGARWDYFNHNRIFEMYLDKNLNNIGYRSSYTVQQMNLINSLGTFSIIDEKKPHFYNFGDGYMLCYYMKELFEDLLKLIPIIDITDKFNREDIKALIRPGKFISFQGGYYLKNVSDKNYGKNQRHLCYYKKDKINLEFEFDAYETTSTSAWGSHLRGKKVITPICYVKGILETKGEMTISLSCLAIGSNFLEHQYRKQNESIQQISSKFDSYPEDGL